MHAGVVIGASLSEWDCVAKTIMYAGLSVHGHIP